MKAIDQLARHLLNRSPLSRRKLLEGAAAGAATVVIASVLDDVRDACPSGSAVICQHWFAQSNN